MTLGIKSFEPGPGIDWLALLLPRILRGKAESLPFQSRFYSSSGVDLRPDPVSLVYEISNPEWKSISISMAGCPVHPI